MGWGGPGKRSDQLLGVPGHFNTQCCQKFVLYQKNLHIKVVQDSILYKKVSGRNVYHQQEWSGEGVFQRLPSLKYYNVLKLAILGASCFTPWVDRHMHPLTFLYETESLTTFI